MSVGEIDITETIGRVETLLREDKSASPQFRATIELLVVIVKLLVNKLGLNSRNSSKPPSTDPNRKRISRRHVAGQKRKPGGQPGRNGINLERVKKPDEIETLEIDRRTLPAGKYEDAGYESRQVIDIKISRFVTEYLAEVLRDSKGKEYVAEFPDGVTRPVQYGKDLKAHAVYMSQHQLIPYERIQDYFSDQCGIPISTGSLCNFNKEAFDLLENFEKIAKERLISEEVVYSDETGINVKAKLLWLHCASSERWTLFFPHEKRGLDAMKAMGVLERFHGILCHDHWKVYFQFKCQYALCNAHHLRELTRAWEQDGQKWAKRMEKLLLKLKDLVEKSGGSISKRRAEKYKRRYRAILRQGRRECPQLPTNHIKPKRGRMKKSKARNLLERLQNFETEVLRFMTDKKVPFTNNQGERDIRMTKVQQKISGCFRSIEGAKTFCRIRSYLSTCTKQNTPPAQALKLLFSGKLPKFAS